MRDQKAEDTDIPILSVQRMLGSDLSGLIHTLDSAGSRKDMLRIEAVYGLSDPLIDGRVLPDVYYVDRSTHRILAYTVAPQMRMLQMRRSGRSRTWTSVYGPVMSGQTKRKLTDGQVQSLSRMALRLERRFSVPQIVEWSIADGQVYILQARHASCGLQTQTPGLDAPAASQPAAI
jgi:pyruvate,water dikinase